jgi:hypothetical protein
MTKQEYEARSNQYDECMQLPLALEYIASLEAEIAQVKKDKLELNAQCFHKDETISVLKNRITELEKQVEWHLFDIDNVNTYPPCADMYLTLSIPERTEYREIDDEETYDVLWFELYSEEYWHKHNVTHWAYLPAPPQEEE